jgi:thioredoxin 1
MSIPTMIVFKNGQPVKNIVGFKPKDKLKEELDAALG